MFITRKVVLSANRRNYQPSITYFFSTVIKGGTPPEKLSLKGGTLEGSQGGYGGPETSTTINQTVESPHGGRPHDHRQGKDNDPAGDVARSLAETAKAGFVGAMETGMKLGDIAKRTADDMWDSARKTAQDLRDTVAEEKEKGDRPRGF
ncbi:late embryogenesis abundant protein [Striga asiatica]|uniref:Late embryogenesis abundant protein n=1 Tax=Striga asiatica TaxID=4170 RepID=A0A5A7QDQ0_STRAF|nr:late embryogenesis abundant protein [Striga asiatica]